MTLRKRKRGRPTRANHVWILPEPNEELDARKLSRAFLALALHRAADEVEAERDHTARFVSGEDDEPAE